MLRRMFSMVLFVLMLTDGVSAEPWSVKLHFPAGRRVVVLDARELGVSWEHNVATEQLMEAGRITTASVVVTGPWFRDSVAWIRQNPAADIGLSVALTNPYERLSWRLLTSELGPTSLVNADGYPWKNVVQFAVNVQAQDMQRELDAQIRAARSAGLNPTHLSGYYGTVFSRPDLAELFLAAAQKYWIPAPIVELTPELIDRFRRDGYPVDSQMIRLIGDYRLPKVDDMQVLQPGTSYEETRDNFCQFFSLIAPGLTHVVCRPAVASDGLARLTPDWQQRVWTAQALADDKVVEAIASNGVILTNWREIMQRFEQDTPRELEQLREEERRHEQSLEQAEEISIEGSATQ